MRRNTWLAACLLTGLTTVIGLPALGTTPVAGSDSVVSPDQERVLPHVVSQQPADFTPTVDDTPGIHAATYALHQVGPTMYAGGSFHEVSTSAGTTLARTNIFAFSATTGAISDTFHPRVDGDVWAIGSAGKYLYIGGYFTHVNGIGRDGIAKIDATTGVLDKTFKPTAVKGPVTEIRLVDHRLIVGGKFSSSLLALNPNTGADTGYIKLGIAGSVRSNAGPTRVYRFAINPAKTKLVAIGNFTTVAGEHRDRAFMVDLGTTKATLASWYYQPLDNKCRAKSEPANLRDVDFSSDGTWFVLVATGFVPATSEGIGRDVCDAAARFETATPHPTKPTWINYSGGDTFHSVAISGNVVYVQGHFRYLDNPDGRDSCGDGCVYRAGIGAIDATTGLALDDFNPGKSRDVGGKDLLITSAGLWVASDGTEFDGENRHGIAFCPED